jgi:hypothetical protein
MTPPDAEVAQAAFWHRWQQLQEEVQEASAEGSAASQ